MKVVSFRIIPFVIVLLVSYGCGMLGPASLKEDRNRYNQVIAYTGSEQMLINLVKLRYRDSSTFLQVSSISTNLQWGASVSAGVDAPGGQVISDLTRGNRPS